MDTIDPKVASAWINRDLSEALRNMASTLRNIERDLDDEREESKSWSRHYDKLHDKYEKLCDALYKIVGLEEHELETSLWIARIALQDAGEWPR